MTDIEIEIILFEIVKIRIEKSECIRLQKYEYATVLRETERNLLDKLFKYIYGDDNKHIYNSCDEYIEKWFVDKYEVSYKNFSLIQLKRHLLLNKLDI